MLVSCQKLHIRTYDAQNFPMTALWRRPLAPKVEPPCPCGKVSEWQDYGQLLSVGQVQQRTVYFSVGIDLKELGEGGRCRNV